MDVSQVRYFLSVLEAGNFTKAAERLSVSQPSLSMGIKRLEQELGVTLFERDSRKVKLSVAGQMFAGRARIILAEYEAAVSELQNWRHRVVLRLGTLRSIRLSVLYGLIGELRGIFPDLLVEVQDGTVTGLRSRLLSGDLDVTLTVLDGHELPDTSLELLRQRLLLAVSPEHPLARYPSLSLQDLEGEPFIDRLHCELRQRRNTLLDCHEISSTVMYRTDNEELVLSLLQRGSALTIMPEWRDLPEVIYLPVEDLELSRTLGLAWRSQLSPELAEVVSVFRRICQIQMASV